MEIASPASVWPSILLEVTGGRGSKIVGATAGGVHSPSSLAHLLWKKALEAPPKCSALT